MRSWSSKLRNTRSASAVSRCAAYKRSMSAFLLSDDALCHYNAARCLRGPFIPSAMDRS
jgi:hypothetical protein